MREERVLNVDHDLKGMGVLEPKTAEQLGTVEDVIVHPTRGSVLGIIMRTAHGEERWFAASEFLVGMNAVMVATKARGETVREGTLPNGSVAVRRELIGANVLTEEGKLLGQVREVYLSTARPQIAYRIAETTLQRLFGGGFFLSGDVPRAGSREGARMIVPANATEQDAFGSAREALQTGQRAGRS